MRAIEPVPVPPSEFRRSLRVLHTRTDVRVDGRTSGVEFLVPVSAWELGYFRDYARKLLRICILGFSRKHFVTLLISCIFTSRYLYLDCILLVCSFRRVRQDLFGLSDPVRKCEME